ncbi:hypothetical protein [Kitasatospora sp. NPDC097643]|uniref:hypothetical protein n=1 Tax=Kitasatospora sp. NPDC097643 TaxID=3157230 RepID=UPI0033192BED
MGKKGTKAPGAPPPFVLWREVVVAYAMPAAMAGIGGAVTRQPQLLVAAATTIAGTSALVAALTGARLRRRPRHSWSARAPRALVTVALGLAAAATALAVGLAAAHWLPRLPALADSPWPGRLPGDLPVSSAIAATVITWRWRGSLPRDPAQRRLPQHSRNPRPTNPPLANPHPESPVPSSATPASPIPMSPAPEHQQPAHLNSERQTS